MDATSWWEVDDKDGAAATAGGPSQAAPPRRTVEGATPLLEVCIATYGWKRDRALRCLRGYRQFLTLKKMLGDFDGKILEPSNIIDQMWAIHYSTPNYSSDCQLLCGAVVERNSYSRVLDPDAWHKRKETTKRLLLKNDKATPRFDTVDDDIWNLKQDHCLVGPIVKDGDKKEDETKIMFRPHGPSLREAQFDMPQSEPFVVAASIYAADQGKEYRDLRFVVDEKDIDPELTLQELGFIDAQVVDVLFATALPWSP